MANELLNQLIANTLFKMNPNLRDNALNQSIAATSDRFRPDNTLKQSGYFGPLQRPDGSVSTELSIGVNFDGNETLIPLLVPTLNKSEVDHLLSGKKETKPMVDKAVQFARQRIATGLSPFATNEEIPYGIKQ